MAFLKLLLVALLLCLHLNHILAFTTTEDIDESAQIITTDKSDGSDDTISEPTYSVDDDEDEDDPMTTTPSIDSDDTNNDDGDTDNDTSPESDEEDEEDTDDDINSTDSDDTSNNNPDDTDSDSLSSSENDDDLNNNTSDDTESDSIDSSSSSDSTDSPSSSSNDDDTNNDNVSNDSLDSDDNDSSSENGGDTDDDTNIASSDDSTSNSDTSSSSDNSISSPNDNESSQLNENDDAEQDSTNSVSSINSISSSSDDDDNESPSSIEPTIDCSPAPFTDIACQCYQNEDECIDSNDSGRRSECRWDRTNQQCYQRNLDDDGYIDEKGMISGQDLEKVTGNKTVLGSIVGIIGTFFILVTCGVFCCFFYKKSKWEEMTENEENKVEMEMVIDDEDSIINNIGNNTFNKYGELIDDDDMDYIDIEIDDIDDIDDDMMEPNIPSYLATNDGHKETKGDDGKIMDVLVGDY